MADVHKKSCKTQFFAAREYVYDNPSRTSSALFSKLSMDNTSRRLVSDLIFSLFKKAILTRNIPLPSDAEKTKISLDVVTEDFTSALINEGTGLNQVVLLLATLIESPKNSVIGIEEPEIHLHPSAQSKLAKILLSMAMDNSKQIIFTTHSEHMVYPFLASIASKKNNSLS